MFYFYCLIAYVYYLNFKCDVFCMMSNLITLRADQAPLDAFREQKRLAREKKLAELEADNQ